MKTFKIEVWYRYVTAGEQEKDFTIISIDANSIEEAIEKANYEFRYSPRIPFKFIYEGIVYKPF